MSADSLPHLLLVLLFLLTIGHLITLKLCSAKLDHRTAPVFISGWTLLGLLATAPAWGHLWGEGVAAFTANPLVLFFAVAKGILLYFLFVFSQQLMQVSLSSRHYVTPLALGLITIGNGLLGESMQWLQWLSCLGLCVAAIGFMLRGHLSDMDKSARMSYAKLVLLSAVLGTLDIYITRQSNWYAGLLVSNVTLFLMALAMTRADKSILRASFFGGMAALAGAFYMATELVKFYQLVTINPGPVVGAVQAMTKPVILVLSALIWKERTVKEQLAWGAIAFIIGLPLILPFD